MKRIILCLLIASSAQAETARNCDRAAWAKFQMKNPDSPVTQDMFFGGKCESWVDGDMTDENTIKEGDAWIKLEPVPLTDDGKQKLEQRESK